MVKVWQTQNGKRRVIAQTETMEAAVRLAMKVEESAWADYLAGNLRAAEPTPCVFERVA